MFGWNVLGPGPSTRFGFTTGGVGGRNTSAIVAQFPAPPPFDVQVNVAELAGAFGIPAQPLF